VAEEKWGTKFSLVFFSELEHFEVPVAARTSRAQEAASFQY
jgi:hypothetical protein